MSRTSEVSSKMASVECARDTSCRNHLNVLLSLYRSSSFDRIAWVKKGVDASFANLIIMYISESKEEALRAVAIPQATMSRWIKSRARLPSAESERVLGVGRLIGQAQALVEESGDAEGFEVGAWLTRWLKEPNAAFGNTRPLELLDTIEGQMMVSKALTRMQSGAYA